MTITEPEVEVELPDPTITVADTLRLAIDVLHERGWTHGTFLRDRPDENGPVGVCALGAIALALGHEDVVREYSGWPVFGRRYGADADPRAIAAAEALAKVIPYVDDAIVSVYHWNDDAWRCNPDVETIIPVLEEAAARADQ